MRSFIRNILALIALALIIASFFKCDPSTDENQKNSNTDKTYKNLDPNVKYVGIKACRQCHYEIYESFTKTEMGMSFGPATKFKSSAKFGTHDVVNDKYSGLSYHPYWSGDTMKIMEFRKEGQDTIYKRPENVDYIIGSGQHTNSHISNTNGYLHQMPMTFYTQKGKWDLPPGFENGENSHFSRKIGLECMSCHNALPQFVQGSENKFKEVPAGISCERCHGPGEIHIKEKMDGIVVDTSKEIDYSIVNPAKLPIDLQFDVCQRCHLQGNSVLKEGRSFLDFRPGMKLSDIETTFLPKYEGADDEFIMASHADRLKQSRCFLKSNKKSEVNSLRPYKNGLTCITCHNPHFSVRATNAEVFNNACKSCHRSTNAETNKSCSEKEQARNKVQNNCVSCHMPKSGSTDIPHVSITDHYIRKPAVKQDIAGIKKFIGLIAINEEHPDPKIKATAYLNQYEKFQHDPALLDSAGKYLSNHTLDDIKNNFSLLIRLRYLKNDFQTIISYAEKIPRNTLLNELLTHTSWTNDDAWTSYRIGEAYHAVRNINNEYLFYKKAADLAPYNLDFLNKLGGNLLSQNKLPEAKSIYEKIISEDSKIASAYCNMGIIYFLEKNLALAEKYYEISLILDPDYENALLNKVQLYYTLGKNKEAIDILHKMLKKDPANEKVKNILKQLSSRVS